MQEHTRTEAATEITTRKSLSASARRQQALPVVDMRMGHGGGDVVNKLGGGDAVRKLVSGSSGGRRNSGSATMVLHAASSSTLAAQPTKVAVATRRSLLPRRVASKTSATSTFFNSQLLTAPSASRIRVHARHAKRRAPHVLRRS
jgi:hypothetical protein